MISRILTALMAVLMLASCREQVIPIEPGVSARLATQRASLVANVVYVLDLSISRDTDQPIPARVVIRFDLADNSQPLQLDFRQQSEAIRALRVNDKETPFKFINEHIVIPGMALQVGANTVTIEFIAGESSLNRRPEFLYTLFVPDRARTAFPLFDQPDIKATFELKLTLPPDWIALANAPAATVERTADAALFHFRPSDRISSYLFSFVAGKFQSVTRVRNGRSMTMLHRETDPEKLARNVERVFDLHAGAIAWMEQYTGIKYPYQKFDFALIPSFQYGGMEHVGAIQYQADSILLDPSPSDDQRLSRASLIAHETAHMWFGDLVTMRWFDDVWTKEVFANFMAAKIINPDFPQIDHSLHFLTDHYPAAYQVDRSAGANAIRQSLANLNAAGQLYGAIIYHKAPIMMRQLETLIGADTLRDGLREYLQTYAFDNATWPDLIAILDARTTVDLRAWSEVWVNSPGRPEFELHQAAGAVATLEQLDPAGRGRLWPQRFALRVQQSDESLLIPVTVTATSTAIEGVAGDGLGPLLFNADGLGYGLFPADRRNLQRWPQLSPLARGVVLINQYEQVLAGVHNRDIGGSSGDGIDGGVGEGAFVENSIENYYGSLLDVLRNESNQLLLSLALRQITRLHNSFLSTMQRARLQTTLESVLWQGVAERQQRSVRKLYFDAFSALAASDEQVQRLYRIWSGEEVVDGLELAENDAIRLALTLAIRLPGQSSAIIAQQLQRTKNPDNRRRLEFLAPSVAADEATRDAFFTSLADERNRRTERWVLAALENLHHPSRTAQSAKYIRPSLDLLQQIQVTGDIFFPGSWVNATLQNHTSDEAVNTVREFLNEHPHYDEQLRMKILQAVDIPLRANAALALQAARDHPGR